MRFPLVVSVWAAILVAGFAAILLLGRPIPTAAEELDAALHPSPPVTQAAAEVAAATIVRVGHPEFEGTERAVRLEKDFGIEHWVVEHTDLTGSAPRGLRISIVVATGRVEVNAFP